MKRIRYLTMPFLMAGLTLMTACTDTQDIELEAEQPVTSEEVQEEVGEATEAIEGYSEIQLEQAQAEAAQQLQGLNQRMDALEVQAEQLGEEAQVEFNDAMVELRQESAQIEQKLDDLQVDSVQAWDAFETEFGQTVNDIEARLAELTTIIESGEIEEE